ncbi:isoleucine--tRNA ligase [Malassezia sp. CBS 17886]|nr:isoleucine--tRNA ligase [Malassezia sp. CBS 17886]
MGIGSGGAAGVRSAHGHAVRVRCLCTSASFPAPLRGTPGTSRAAAAKADNAFRDTLHLPETGFSIRAFAKEREPLFRWATTTGLYRWQRENLGRGAGGYEVPREFVLHDGPPYANGPLHMGHALNKILKDITLRYMPGWDCHGLPIELRAVHESAQEEMSPLEIRAAARAVAEREIARQRDTFQSFAVMADWAPEATYRTMDFSYELTQLELFAKFVDRGLVFEQNRPVYWSPSSHTALAEAEIEYDENHCSRSAYVCFDLHPSASLQRTLQRELGASAAERIALVVWTTTPWTLLGNMALAVSRDASYSVVRRVDTGDLLVVATDLVGALEAVELGIHTRGARGRVGALEEVARFPGALLVASQYRFVLAPQGHLRKILDAPFVTTLSGTGVVHMAPAHGQEDYRVWRDGGHLAASGLASPVDDRGCLVVDEAQVAASSPRAQAALAALHGTNALGCGTAKILALLQDHGALLGEMQYRHSYPIDWRTKQPVITRATSQWFANLADIETDVAEALHRVHFVPSSARNRLSSLVARRSEWCISRQRAWGVPLPVVYNAATGAPLLTRRNIEHILSVFREYGTMDCWWTQDAAAFVAPEYRTPGTSWTRRCDTLDVWFDSGSSWAELEKARGAAPDAGTASADVYLEGGDQHRGWFQSSLLTRVSASGRDAAAPYTNLLSHGFVVDSEGRKMSKSLGNVIAPDAFVAGVTGNRNFPAFGTDTLRWWSSKADYTKEMPVSPLIMKHAHDEVRKLRNTARFLLANVGQRAFVPLRGADAREMASARARAGHVLTRQLDRFVLHELLLLDRACRDAYASFNFMQVTRRVNEFVTTTLSSLYLEVVKDTLYAGSGPHRAAVVATLDQDPAWENPALAEFMRTLLTLRSEAFALLTSCRQEGLLKSAPEATVDVLVPTPAAFGRVLRETDPGVSPAVRNADRGAELADIFSVAAVDVYVDAEAFAADAARCGASWQRTSTVPSTDMVVRLRPSLRHKCPRCWRHVREESEELCGRCAGVVKGG